MEFHFTTTGLLGLLGLCCYMLCVFSTDVVVEYQIKPAKEKKPCTYYESVRTSTAAPGLVNCSWYATNACCKRTEVTSVFANMYPLYGASQGCRNRINYMMCYFCSPAQMIWYKEPDKKVHICSEFCSTVFEHCKDARFEGKKIGDQHNSTSFCEAQNFHIVNGKENCFNFDPTVFGHASSNLCNAILIWSLLCLIKSLKFI